MRIILSNKEQEAISNLKASIKNIDGNIDVDSIKKSYKGISVEDNEVSFSEELVCDFLKIVKDMAVAILSVGPMLKLVFKGIVKQGKEFEDKWEVKINEK